MEQTLNKREKTPFNGQQKPQSFFRSVGYAELSSSGRSLKICIDGKPHYYVNLKTIAEIINRPGCRSKAATVFVLEEE